MKYRYEQVLSDFEYLSRHGLPFDVCGAVCNTWKFIDVLRKKISITDELIHFIEVYWENGYDDIQYNTWRDTDERCQRIRRRYNIEKP